MPIVPLTVELPFGIVIALADGRAALQRSRLVEQFVDDDDHDNGASGMAAANAVEALLLSLVAAGVTLETPAARAAIESAVEAIANHLD